MKHLPRKTTTRSPDTDSFRFSNAIYIIRYCLNKSSTGYSLEQESYMKWTARELLSRLRKNPTVSPLIIIDDFYDLMDKYSMVNPNTAIVFDTAKEFTEWIINLLSA